MDLKHFFFYDDRTGIPSNTKFIRSCTFFVAMLWVFFCAGMIIWSIWNPVPDESEKFIDSVSNLIIFLFGGAEASYQVNRRSKLSLGNAPLKNYEEEEEEEKIVEM